MTRLQKLIVPAIFGTFLLGYAAYCNTAIANKNNTQINAKIIYSVDGVSKPLSQYRPEEQVSILKQYLRDKPQIRDAVVVRSFDNPDAMNMYGRTVVDAVTAESTTGKSRYSLQVHPYPWQPAGAIIVPIWRDKDGIPHVVLVHNQRKDKERKQWRLSEGFMHPKPCAGSDKIAVLDSDVMDEAEELILRKKLDVATAYERAIAENKIKLIGAGDVTAYDTSLEDTARREAKEEIGLNLNGLDLILSGHKTDRMTIHCYLVDLNQTGSPFKLSPPTLTPDGTEVIEARWVPVKDFTFKIVNKEIVISVGDVPVPIYYALAVSQALSKLHENDISQRVKNSLPPEFDFNTKEQLLESVLNLPGSTREEKLANWKTLSSLHYLSLQ